MLATYLTLLILGLGTIWLGLQIGEEVYRIAMVFSGGVLLVMGFAIAPALIQIGFALLVLGIYRIYAPQPRF